MSVADHDDDVVADHDDNEVELVDGHFVLVCACGWRSPPCRDAASVGVAWDDHRRDARR